MNRRQVIQALLYGSTAVAIPIGAWLPVFDDNPDFDPTKQYGNFVLRHDAVGDFSQLPYEQQEKLIAVMATDARRSLPKGTKFGIIHVYKHSSGTDDIFAETNIIAWKYPYRDYMQLAVVA